MVLTLTPPVIVTMGLDLGQKRDFTALVVTELEQRDGTPHYTVRGLERLPLGTLYPAIVPQIKRRFQQVEARAYDLAAERTRRRAAEVIELEQAKAADRGGRYYLPDTKELERRMYQPSQIFLYVDATGVGQPVLNMLTAEGLPAIGCYFNHGDRRAVQDNQIIIGKAWLVSRLQVLLQSGRIHLPRTAEADILAKELLDYEIRVSENANDTYGAFKVGSHDDLVTALGLAVQHEPYVRTWIAM